MSSSFTRKGVDLSKKYDRDQTILHVAATSKNTNIFKLFLSKTKNINEKNDVGMTPLHVAAIMGCTDTAKLLVEAGADITIANAFRKTPLQTAQGAQEKEIEDLLQSELKKRNQR